MKAIDNEELRQQILTEFKQVLKLAPADYTENCTNVVMSLLSSHITAVLDKAIQVVDGKKVDVEATRKHMESKGVTEEQIFNMELEADDTNSHIDEIITALRQLYKGGQK